MPTKAVIAATCDACVATVIIDRDLPPESLPNHRIRFNPDLQAKVTRLTRTYDSLNAVVAYLDECFKRHLKQVKENEDREAHLAFGAWFLRERLINIGPGRHYREGPGGLVEL